MISFAIEFNGFNVIMLLLSAVAGSALFVASVFILNKAPAKWFCDYDEEPSQELLTQTRFKGKSLFIFGTVVSALAFALIYLFFGMTMYTLLLMLITFAMIMVILSDGKYCIIPDELAVILALLSVTFAYYDLAVCQYFIRSWWSPLVSGIGVGALIIAVNFITMLIAKKEGMGFGDVKLFAALGLATGIPQILTALFVSVITAFVIIVMSLLISAVKKKEIQQYIPFGPSICIGVFATLVLREPIACLIGMYVSLMAR